MTERFYSIDHLSTLQLRELYTLYACYGWTDTEFYTLVPKDVKRPELPFNEIILNIYAGHKHNYFVLMNGCEDEEDGIMIGLGMSGYPEFAVYLHLPDKFLNELVLKYELNSSKEAKNYTIEEYLMEEAKDNPVN